MAFIRESPFKKPLNQEKELKKDRKTLPVRLAFSTAIGWTVFILLLLAGAAVCLKLDLPRERLTLVGIPLAAAAAFLAGYLHVRPSRKQGLLSGLLSGAALYAGVLLLGVAISRAPLGVNAVLLLLAALLGGAAGGIFSANRRPADNRSAKSRRR